MSTESRKKDRIFFSFKEDTAGTPDTTCFFEGNGEMTPPESEYQFESNYGKLGSGEHGKGSELQAVWTPFSYKCKRLSEIAYFMSFFQGKSYTPGSVGSGEQHEFLPLPVSSRVLPTFSFQYGIGGNSENIVFSGCVINEFNITLAAGGNGIIDATFSGWGNKHRLNEGLFILNADGSMNTGTYDITSEPYINFKCCHFYKADSADYIRENSATFTGDNLGANVVDISTLVNSITMTGNNGMTAEDKARAGGCGIINDWQRGDRQYTLELNMRKDIQNGIVTNTLIQTNKKLAIECLFEGKIIGSTDPYAMDWIFPVVQCNSGAEDDGSPISKTIPFSVFQDSIGIAMECFAQTKVEVAYNGIKV